MVETFKDLVCYMHITPETSAETSQYEGKTYYFCSSGCKQSFDQDPEKYVSAAEAGESVPG